MQIYQDEKIYKTLYLFELLSSCNKVSAEQSKTIVLNLLTLFYKKFVYKNKTSSLLFLSFLPFFKLNLIFEKLCYLFLFFL